jgi:hypothetical protein
MQLTKVHLFVILLLALVFCSVFSGVCGGYTLEGFNSGQYSSYDKMYSANNKYAKSQDTLYNRKDKPLASGSHDDSGSSSYAPYSSSSNSSSGSGIPGSQIPPGQEDLYILKSEIVPPVCPACPSMKCDGSSGGGGGGGGGGGAGGDGNKCPPCPPCARCPEPAFECKKVPNYNTANDNVFPHPVLNSFSQFGM